MFYYKKWKKFLKVQIDLKNRYFLIEIRVLRVTSGVNLDEKTYILSSTSKRKISINYSLVICFLTLQI